MPRERLLVEYVNVLVSFFAKIHVQRAEMQVNDKDIFWKDIYATRMKFPLPTLETYFGDSYPQHVYAPKRDIFPQVIYTIRRLNETEDVFVWKRGVNRLLFLLQDRSYTPMYPEDTFSHEESLDEPL